MIADITLREFIAGLFLAGGAFFLLASAIGMLRLPDFYCRLHASGNSETLGVMLSFLGLVIYEGLTLTSLKMIMIFLLIFLGNPIGTHILSKAAYKSGHHDPGRGCKGGEESCRSTSLKRYYWCFLL